MPFSLCIISVVHAEEESTEQETPSPLQGQVELGYQRHTGNTNTESLNVNVLAEYTEGRHRTTGKWEFYRLDKYGGEYKRKSTYSLQSPTTKLVRKAMCMVVSMELILNIALILRTILSRQVTVIN